MVLLPWSYGYCDPGGVCQFHKFTNVISLILITGVSISNFSGEIGLNFTVSGNVTAFAALALIFKGTLFTFLGFIPAFTSVSTGGSKTVILLAIP